MFVQTNDLCVCVCVCGSGESDDRVCFKADMVGMNSKSFKRWRLTLTALCPVSKAS